MAAGFAGALPGLRLAPHIVKHTCGATQKNAHIENHTPHHTHKGKNNSIILGIIFGIIFGKVLFFLEVFA